jgi:sugar phosphate isomerase/epimerase
LNDILITMNSFTTAEISKKGYLNIFRLIKAAGFSGVEIRRELLSEQSPSITDIKSMLKELSLVGYYSCPIPLFDEKGSLNEYQIKQAMIEGESLDARLIKFSLGHYYPDSSLDVLKALAEPAIGRYCLTVENDQTQEGGKAERLAEFFNRCKREEIPLSFTCDLGNWLYVQENPEASIKKMKAHTKYIHIKEVIQQENSLKTVSISNHAGSEWKRLLNAFAKGTPMAVEFPINTRNLKDYYSLITERGAQHYETV